MNKNFYSLQNNLLLTLLKVLLCFFLVKNNRATNSFIKNIDLGSVTTLDPNTRGFTITGKDASTYFGSSISSVGDINKDGYSDIAIGDLRVGVVYVIYGGPSSSVLNQDLGSQPLDPATTGFTVKGRMASDLFGTVVSAAGDINNDGYDDILIGADFALGQRGAAYVVYGRPKSLLSNIDLSSQTLDPATTGFTISGSGNPTFLGGLLNPAGDINKDGYDDIIVAAYESVLKVVFYVIYGRPTSDLSHIDLSSQTLDPTTTGFTISGNSQYPLGRVLNTAGDVNKDGYDDLIVHCYGQYTYFVLYGREKSLSSNIIFTSKTLDPTIPGFAVGLIGGQAAGPAGDIDGDGYDDIIISDVTQGNSQGAVFVIYGGPTPPSPNINLDSDTLDPATTGLTISGSSSSALQSPWGKVGDINKDGYDDIMMFSIPTGTNYVLYGGPRSSLSNINFVVTSLDPATTGFIISNIGQAVQTAGDVNGDGYPDIMVADPTRQGNNGLLYVIHSACVHTNTCPLPITICPTCNSGGGPQDPECTKCPSNCKQYENDLSCEICQDGYFLSKGAFGGVCSKCLLHCSLCTSQSSCQACENGYVFLKSFCLLQSTLPSTSSPVPSTPSSTSKKEKAKALQAISSAVTGAGSFLCVGNTRFPLAALVSKIVQNTRYINLTVTGDLAEIYETWDTDLISWQVPGAVSKEDEFKTSPALFHQYGLDSPFLANFWTTLMTVIVGAGVLAISFVIRRLFERAKYEGRPSKLVQKLFVGSFNFVIVQVYGCLDDILFNAVLDMKTNPFNTFYSWASIILAVVFMVLGGLLVFFNLWTVKKYQKIKMNKRALEAFNERNKYWELFYSEFNDEDFWTQSALALFVLRSIATSFIIIVLYDYPLMQTVYLIILDGVVLLFLLFKMPFPTLRGKLAQYYFEAITLLVHISAFSLAMQDSMPSYSGSLKSFLCTTIIYLNSTLVTGGIAFMSIEIYKLISEKTKAGKKKQKGEIATQTMEIQDMTERTSVMMGGIQQHSETNIHRRQISLSENFHLLSGFTQENNNNVSFTGVNFDSSSNYFHPNINANNSVFQQQGIEMNDSINYNISVAPSLRKPKIRKVRIHQQ